MPFLTKISPLIKTPTHSSIYGRRSTCFTAAPLTLLPIASMLDAAVAAAASGGTGSIKVYLAIAISIRIDIVYKQVTNIAKDIQAIDRWFGKFEDSLSEIKDKLTFLRRGVIVLVYNTGLLDIEYR